MKAVEGPLMMAIPNMTGPMHIGNAMVFWFTAHEAMRRGIPWGWYFDDTYPRMEARPTYEIECATRQSCCEFEQLLDVRPSFHIHKTQRRTRYWEIVEKLKMAGLAYEIRPGTALLTFNGRMFAHDIIHGRMISPYAVLTQEYRVESYFRYAVDMYDYRVPLHVRGKDLMPECLHAMPFVDAVRELWKHDPRPETEYAHLPQVFTEDGEKLDKLRGLTGRLQFSEWAKQFDTPKERQRALAALVMPEPFPEDYKLADALDANFVYVNDQGVRTSIGIEAGPMPYNAERYRKYPDPSINH